MRCARLFLVALCAVAAGCGGRPGAEFGDASPTAAYAKVEMAASPAGLDTYREAAAPLSEPMMGMMAGAAPGGTDAPQDAPPANEVLSRKIIYDAKINLLIEAIDSTAAKLVELVQKAGGYVAEQNIAGSPGSVRSGQWKVRIPVERFESFVQGVVGLGELELNQRTSQDVTEQFYDVEARIKNSKVEEQTLLKILDERGGKLEDVLKVEVELSRVRGEIEQLEGRIRVLQNLSSLATVTIGLREREKFEPPAPAAPSFPTRLARAWDESIQEIRRGLESLAESVVRILPRLPFYLVEALLAFFILRWLFRRIIRSLPRWIEMARRPLFPPPPPDVPAPPPQL